MDERKQALDLISWLKKKKIKATCNNCDEDFDLSKAKLFYGNELPESVRKLYEGRLTAAKLKMKTVKEKAKQKIVRVEAAARSVNIGFVVEKIAPSLHGFRYDKNDSRSLFDPIDYLIFDGLTNGKRIEKIVFADIKSGKARLNQRQQQIRNAVQNKRVTLAQYFSGAAK